MNWVDFDLSNKFSTVLTTICKDANAARSVPHGRKLAASTSRANA